MSAGWQHGKYQKSLITLYLYADGLFIFTRASARARTHTHTHTHTHIYIYIYMVQNLLSSRRYPMRALGPGVYSASDRNEYQKH
jgi:hypothetical protein